MTVRLTLTREEAEAVRDLLTAQLLDVAFRFGDEAKMKCLLQARNKLHKRIEGCPSVPAGAALAAQSFSGELAVDE